MYIDNFDKLRDILKDSKVIICDLDGTIADSEEMHFGIWVDTLKENLGIEITDYHIQRYISHNDESICNMVKEDFDVNFLNQDIIAKKRANVIRFLSDNKIENNKFLYKLLDDTSFCKNNRYLVTSQDINVGTTEISNIGMDKMFNTSYWNVKDKEDLYNLILEISGDDYNIRNGFVLFEDSVKYLEIGKKLGFKVVAVEHNYNKDKLKKYLEDGNSLDIIRI